MTDTAIADLWFDPVCPYTWITSRWLLEAARVRPVEVRWHLLSLAALNEDKEEDPEGDTEGFLWLPARVAMAVTLEHGQEALGRFYTAFGERVHENDWDENTFADSLADAKLPTELADAATSTALDDQVRSSTFEGLDLVGRHVGSPVVAVTPPGGERVAFFGPVLSRIPRGEEAGRLWDGAPLVAGVRGFNKIEGPPQAEPDFS
ncbi:mycothiol-dependent nitroreductase Rv2466c family protein [Actinomadura hibisca]|uniref:mycothiol-dependent nitroreductase Rv2466c family protein n=1 Tax=Actinomadura hibisca TaxID=68565 RepID=UPI0008349806|nr:disulfide bond formation protein DsbA [Actinomadura hibisca]